MSWLISRALMEAYENSLSLQEPVAEYSEASCSGGEPSALLNGNPSALGFSRSDRTMGFFRRSRSGMTFEHLTEDLGEELLTWYLAGFPART